MIVISPICSPTTSLAGVQGCFFLSPHVLVSPFTNCSPRTVFVLLHEHRHSHLALPALLFSARSKTVSSPNTWPVRSRTGVPPLRVTVATTSPPGAPVPASPSSMSVHCWVISDRSLHGPALCLKFKCLIFMSIVSQPISKISHVAMALPSTIIIAQIRLNCNEKRQINQDSMYFSLQICTILRLKRPLRRLQSDRYRFNKSPGIGRVSARVRDAGPRARTKTGTAYRTRPGTVAVGRGTPKHNNVQQVRPKAVDFVGFVYCRHE